MEKNCQNTYVNYKTMSVKSQKKLDVKGLIATICGLITSIVVGLSTLMPIITLEKGKVSEKFNIFMSINLFKNMLGRIKHANLDIAEYTIYLIVALLPIMLAVVGILGAIIYICRLTTRNYTKNLSGFLWVVFILEILIVSLQNFYIGYLEYSSRGFNVGYAKWMNGLSYTNFAGVYYDQYQDIESNCSLSVGWYLPIILVFILILAFGITEMILMLKTNKCTLSRIYSAVGVLLSIGVLISIGSQLSLTTSFACIGYLSNNVYSEYDVSLLQLLALMQGEGSIYILVMFVLTIIMVIFGYISLIRNMSGMIVGKYRLVINMLTGFVAIVFVIIKYIMFDMLAEEKMSWVSISFFAGVETYCYIIFTSILLVLSFVYVCSSIYYKKRKVLSGITYIDIPQPAMQYVEMNQQEMPNKIYSSNDTRSHINTFDATKKEI